MSPCLENPSRQSRTLWDLVEEIGYVLKLFVLFQPHQFYYFPPDRNGFEVDRPIVYVG